MDRGLVSAWARDRSRPAKPNPRFFVQLATLMHRVFLWGSNADLHLVATWMLATDTLIRSVRSKHALRVVRGNIVDIELGLNPEGEYSLAHPCIVLKAFGNTAVVVPLTSKRFGRGLPTGAGAPDPSSTPTGARQWQVNFVLAEGNAGSSALVDQVRVVSKQRMLNVWSQRVPTQVLQTIEFVLMQMLAPGVLAELHASRAQARPGREAAPAREADRRPRGGSACHN